MEYTRTNIEHTHTRSQPFNCGIFSFFFLFLFERIYSKAEALNFWSRAARANASHHQQRFGWDFSRAQLRDFSHSAYDCYYVYINIYVRIRGSCNVSRPECLTVFVCCHFRFFIQLFIAYILYIRHERRTCVEYIATQCTPPFIRLTANKIPSTFPLSIFI